VETRAHYALVGAVVIVMSLAVALFVVWLGKYSFDQETVEYDVVFTGPVRGLSDSSEVRFNGIKVGEVTRLGLDPSNPNRVIARIRVDALTPVKEDSVAQIEPQGLTGVAYIQITGGTPDEPTLHRKAGRGPPPVIFAKESPLEGFVANAEGVMNEAEKTLQRVQDILSEENVDEFSRTMTNIREVTDEIRANKDLFERTASAITKLEQAADSITKIAESGDDVLNSDVRDAIADIEAAAAEIQNTAKEVGDFANSADATLNEFTGTSTAQVSRLMSDLRRLTESLDRMVGEFEENPSSFIAGSPKKEVEIPR